MAAKKVRKFPKAGTIGNIVLTAMAKNPNLTVEDILKDVLKKFPESKFNKAHLAWYKHQVKVGNYVMVKGDVKAGEKAGTSAKAIKKPRKKSAKKTGTPVSAKV